MIDIQNYRSVNRDTLMGYFDVVLPKWNGFMIKDFCLYQKDNSKWVNFPSKCVEINGVKKYFPVCTFSTKMMGDKFKELVLKAVLEYIQMKGGNNEARMANSYEDFI